MTTDTSERGLESLICVALTGHSCLPGASAPAVVAEDHGEYGAPQWIGGDPREYERGYCVDLAKLEAFLRASDPAQAEALQLGSDNPARHKFLARLQGEITRRGTVDVLRKGVEHGPHSIKLYHGTPSAGNAKAAERHAHNIFSVTRQVRYSNVETQRALDLVLFINGLPIATFELKNSLTKQTAEDAVEQYRRDRDPREPLFALGRCIVHFAVDDQEVRFCTHLKGKDSWFLPFNQGWNDGAGNPPNPDGLKTDFLWRQILRRQSLTDIIENFAQVVEERNEKTGKKKRVQIFPRYHQLDVVRKLLADATAHGAGSQSNFRQHSPSLPVHTEPGFLRLTGPRNLRFCGVDFAGVGRRRYSQNRFPVRKIPPGARIQPLSNLMSWPNSQRIAERAREGVSFRLTEAAREVFGKCFPLVASANVWFQWR